MAKKKTEAELQGIIPKEIKTKKGGPIGPPVVDSDLPLSTHTVQYD